MSNEQLFNYILLLIIGLVVNGWIKFYFEYFKKSGEYQAINENIGRVTTEVEGIKSQLEIAIHKKTSLASLEMESIFTYAEKFALWESKISALGNYDNDEAVDQTTEKIKKSYDAYKIAESKLEFFIDDKDFVKKKLMLTVSAIELQGKNLEILLSLKQIQNEADNYISTFKGTPQFKIETYKGIMDKLLPVRQNFTEVINNEYFVVAKNYSVVLEVLKSRLFKIS